MGVLWLCLLQLAVYVATRAQSCTNGDIRMTNSSARLENDIYYLAGGLQVCVESKWATVCQLNWDDRDATVACRQLGLYYEGGICLDSCYGNILTNPAFYDYQCSGEEAKLADCIKTRQIGCENAVGVHCSMNRTTSTSYTATPLPLTTTGSATATPYHESTSPDLTNCPPVTVCAKCSERDARATIQDHTPNTAQQQTTGCSSIERTMFFVIIAFLFTAFISALCGITVLIAYIKWNKKEKDNKCTNQIYENRNGTSNAEGLQHNVSYAPRTDEQESPIYDFINIS